VNQKLHNKKNKKKVIAPLLDTFFTDRDQRRSRDSIDSWPKFFYSPPGKFSTCNATLTIICNATLTMYFFKGDQANSAAEVAQKGPFTVSLITTKGILLILNGTNKTFTLNTCQYLVSRNLLKRCHERVV
jgi:hypothetical protein